MKQRLIGRAVLLGGSVLTAVLCVGLYVGARATAAPPVPTAESSAPTAPAVGYVVGQWEGLLAVFAAGDRQPLEVYDIYIAALPREEQVRLTAGIPAADDEALARLLEDYTS